MARGRVRVHAQRLEVDVQMTDALRSVDEQQRTGLVGDVREVADRLDRPRHVARVLTDDRPGAVGRDGRRDACRVHDAGAVGIDDHDPNPGAGENVQRPADRVVLHRGDDDPVARREQPLEHQVAALGAARQEEEVPGIAHAEQLGEASSRLEDETRRLECHRIGATAGVGPLLAHRCDDRVDDLGRLRPRGGAVVEVHGARPVRAGHDPNSPSKCATSASTARDRVPRGSTP